MRATGYPYPTEVANSLIGLGIIHSIELPLTVYEFRCAGCGGIHLQDNEYADWHICGEYRYRWQER